MQRFINNWAAELTAPAAATDVSLSLPSDDLDAFAGLEGDVELAFYEVTAALRDETGKEVAWEIMRAYGRAGTLLNVVRGSTPLNLPTGTKISGRISAQWLNKTTADVSASRRFAHFTDGANLVLDGQLGAYIHSATTGAVALDFQFEYASPERRELDITIELRSADATGPLLLQLPAGWDVYCDLPAGAATEIDEVGALITLPSSAFYVIQISGCDEVRMSIRTSSSYIYLSA